MSSRSSQLTSLFTGRNRPLSRRPSAFVLALCIMVGVPVEVLAKKVVNASFEEGESATPAGWSTKGDISLSRGSGRSGESALLIQHDKAKTSSASQFISCGPTPTLSLVWVKAENVEGKGARIRILGPDGQLVGESKAITGSHDWHPVALPFNGGSSGKVTVELSLEEASGKVWFDELVIGERSKTLPKLKEAGALRENIALNKSYVYTPNPNYVNSIDPTDNVKLTDGRYAEGYYWVQRDATVGWLEANPAIIVDLGAVEPIDRIMINSAGGGYVGVKYPSEVQFLVSDDNETFHEVSKVDSSHLLQNGKYWYTHGYEATNLKTRGRYVMIRLTADGTTTFADEIEVNRGDFDPATVTFHTKPISRTEIAYNAMGLNPDSYRRGHFPETSHTDWAIPLAQGPIKAIVLNWDDNMRDVAEIVQRLDLDYVPVSHRSFFSLVPISSLAEEQILDSLPESEVMIVGRVPWKAIPPDVIEKIKARVKDGMGLICIGGKPEWLEPIKGIIEGSPTEGEAEILARIDMTLIPAYQKPAGSHFKLSTYGKGRVAVVNPGTFTRDPMTLLPQFELSDLKNDTPSGTEYYFAAFNKLIQWGAQRESKEIAAINASPEKIEIEIGPGESHRKLEIIVSDSLFAPVQKEERAIPKEGGTFVFTALKAENGTHPIAIWLRDENGKVIDFGTASYKVRNEVRLGNVKFTKEAFAPGEAVAAEVDVRGPSKGTKLRVRLMDSYDREVAPSQTIAVPESGRLTVQIPYSHPVALAGKLSLELLQGDRVLEKRMQRFFMDLPAPEDFTFTGWYALDYQPASLYCMRLLNEMGVDNYVSLPTEPGAQMAAYGNLRHSPENVERVIPANRDNSLIRVPCLTDPEYLKGVEKKIKRIADENAPYSVLEWSMGDEESLGRNDYCHSPSCLAGLREYLKSKYASLDALNENWGSAFTKWEDVVPSTLKQVKNKQKIGSWLDHRVFMENVFTEYHDWSRKLITERIPKARVGLSGTPELNSFYGYDWWKLMNGPLTHLSGYIGIQSAIQRSFLQPGTFFTSFLGYDVGDDNEQRAKRDPWDQLFNGASGINYYTLICDPARTPLLRSDLSRTRKAEWFFPQLDEIKAGTGKLFMGAKYKNDGIAIHYSPNSVHSGTAGGLMEPGVVQVNYNINMANLGMILRESHYQYDFIHEEQMSRGDLANYKILYLPWSSSISDKEVGAIRKFVEDGGTVISDGYCGLRNEHGKAQAMLDDLFGVRQYLVPPKCEQQELVLKNPKGNSSSAPLFVASGASRIDLDGGTALATVGSQPAFIVNKVGKGTTIFLNFSFTNYASMRAGGGGEVLVGSVAAEHIRGPIRKFVKEMFTEAGVPVVLPVKATEGAASEVELSRFQLGEAMLLGFTRAIHKGAIDPTDILSIEIPLPKVAHAYDSRKGTYLGHVDKLRDQLLRGDARVYTLLPYKVESVSITGKKEAVVGEHVTFGIKVNATDQTSKEGPLSQHVFHVTVKGPDGKKHFYHTKNVLAKEGAASFSFPFAHNDAAGEWQVTAKDVSTGQVGQATIDLIPKIVQP